jgi:hypothetical protein
MNWLYKIQDFLFTPKGALIYFGSLYVVIFTWYFWVLK